MILSLYSNNTFCPLPLIARGKVRDIYRLNEQQLLLITTDRISAYDVILANNIPDKGKILTALSCFWFKQLQHICQNHLISIELPQELLHHASILAGRTMIVTQYPVLPIEAIVRGYLAGSSWKEYVSHGTVHGIPLRPGLQYGQALDTPLFTPSTKAKPGDHDENLHPSQISNQIGEKHAKEMERLSLMLYKEAHAYALKRGIIIADTKFEFGVNTNDELVLIDEVLTPDSSRFWLCNSPVDTKSCSLDKQYIRDWLETHNMVGKANTVLPDAVVEQTRQKYIQVYEQLTGESWVNKIKENDTIINK
ncbi:hypothetical protein PCANB_000706 [Pneumocystis canis]|nr:hypothetical protein PCANB_000706 [Pneumocystis canis]